MLLRVSCVTNMSSGRIGRMKSKGSSLDILDKKVPVNPKYKHIKPTVDTGASLSKYMQKIEEIRKSYRYKKDELFKRMKWTTFIQLVIQVAEYENLKTISTPVSAGRPDSTDLEVQKIQAGSPCPSLAVTEGDYGETAICTSRSTLESVIRGIGEVDIDLPPTPTQTPPTADTCPYLLLDVRDKDAYNQCHIISALNYPTAMLSRTNNSERKEMLAYKNKPGRIILMYDYDEDMAPRAASTIVERGFDNLFMLSGGLKMAMRLFPEGLITGTPPQPLGAKKKTENVTMASQIDFSERDIERLNSYLDKALEDHSIGSRLSKASCSSRSSYDSCRSRSTPSLHNKPPFRA